MSCPAISNATVANVPMSGGANVIASTMVAPRTPIDQSHGGWWIAATMPPPRPRMTASSTRIVAAMTVPNAAACTDPTRRPSAPRSPPVPRRRARRRSEHDGEAGGRHGVEATGRSEERPENARVSFGVLLGDDVGSGAAGYRSPDGGSLPPGSGSSASIPRIWDGVLTAGILAVRAAGPVARARTGSDHGPTGSPRRCSCCSWRAFRCTGVAGVRSPPPRSCRRGHRLRCAPTPVDGADPSARGRRILRSGVRSEVGRLRRSRSSRSSSHPPSRNQMRTPTGSRWRATRSSRWACRSRSGGSCGTGAGDSNASASWRHATPWRSSGAGSRASSTTWSRTA